MNAIKDSPPHPPGPDPTPTPSGSSPRPAAAAAATAPSPASRAPARGIKVTPDHADEMRHCVALILSLPRVQAAASVEVLGKLLGNLLGNPQVRGGLGCQVYGTGFVETHRRGAI